MAFDFPTAPAVGDTFEEGGIKYTWSGTAWDLFTTATANEFVLKAGDIMTGTGALAFNTAAFNISANVNFDYNAPTGAAHKFYVNAVEKFDIAADGVDIAGNTRINAGYLEINGAALYVDSANSTNSTAYSAIISRTSDNKGIFEFRGRKGGFVGGNNEGTLELYTWNGGYGFQRVFTTNVASPPSVSFNGSISSGSTVTCQGVYTNTGTGLGLRIGDNWHGWEWTSTYNGEVLKSYQGKYGFHKSNGTVPGTLQFQIDDAGGTAHMAMSASRFVDRSLLADPELKQFAEGEDTEPNFPHRGVNLGKLLLHALAKIKALEAEVATLKKGRR